MAIYTEKPQKQINNRRWEESKCLLFLTKNRQELTDQAAAALNGSDLMCAQAAKTALDCLERENG